MDDPTHANESFFWDRVADWLLDGRACREPELTDAQIESMLRELRDDLDAS